MPKQESYPKYQRVLAGTITSSSVSGGSMVHNSLSGRGADDCHSQYLLLSTLFPSVRVRNSGAQEIPDDDVTVILFDTEEWDTAGFHSTTTNTSRLTVPVGYSGTYLMIANGQFEANAAGQRGYAITKNSTGNPLNQVQHTNATAVSRMGLIVTALDQLDDEEWVEFRVFQSSGGGLDIRAIDPWSPSFMMIRLGPK